MKRVCHFAFAIALVACGSEPSEPAPGSLRTLTPLQYEASLRAIFGDEVPSQSIGPRPTSLASGSAGIGDSLLVAYKDSALEVSGWAFVSDEERRQRLTGCEPIATPSDPCLRSILSRIGRLAFRRPLTASELDRYTVLGAELGTTSAYEGLAFAVSGLLQSPHFLYRQELIDEDEEQLQYTQGTVATRLAYFLWNEPPDDALLLAVERGDLGESAGLASIVTTMLADPRSDEGRLRVLAELFHLELLDEIEKDPNVFPEFDAELRAAMVGQLELTLSSQAKQGPLSDLFTSRDTFVNDRLASLYGLPGAFDATLRPFTLEAGDQRAGVLTLPGLLAARAYPGHTSVALRGLFVRSDLLCHIIPPPPPDVAPTLRVPNDGELVTTRDLLAEHQNNASCRGCHELMDPIGLALEQFNAVGRFRDTQNGLPIDAAGDLDGVAFNDAAGLGAALAVHPELDACFATNIYKYGIGRDIGAQERREVTDLILATTEGRLELDEILYAIATSELFMRVPTP